MKWSWALVAALMLGGSWGCQNLARPQLVGPGPAPYQQARAHQFDPYPENGSAPTIVGSRPMEFQNPPSEVQHARPTDLQNRWFPWLPLWQ